MKARRDQCAIALKIAMCFPAIILCKFLPMPASAAERVRGPVVVRLALSNTCVFIPKGKSYPAKNILEGVEPIFNLSVKRTRNDTVFRVQLRFDIARTAKSSQLCRFVKMNISGSTERYRHKAVLMIRTIPEEELAFFVDGKDVSQQQVFKTFMREKFSMFNHMFGLKIRSAVFTRHKRNEK